MVVYLSSGDVLKVLIPIQSQEAGPVIEIEMIKLSSLEWYLLLSDVVLIIWLLILFQARSSGANALDLESDVIHQEVSDSYAGNHHPDKSGTMDTMSS